MEKDGKCRIWRFLIVIIDFLLIVLILIMKAQIGNRNSLILAINNEIDD